MLQTGQHPYFELVPFIYTLCWAAEDKIQTFRNYRLQSVQGYSMDFYILDLISTIFYIIYAYVGFFAHVEGIETVVLRDIIYSSLHISFLAIQAYQFYKYPRGKNRLHIHILIIAVSMWLLIIAVIFLLEIFKVTSFTKQWNFLSFLAYSKLFLNAIKYIPVVYWNYWRRTTKGWPTPRVIMDIVGCTIFLASGSFSFHDIFHVIKFATIILSLGYDCIFLTQRFILYPRKKQLVNQKLSLKQTQGSFQEYKEIIE